MYKRWRQEQATEEEYRSITEARRNGIRKAKTAERCEAGTRRASTAILVAKARSKKM